MEGAAENHPKNSESIGEALYRPALQNLLASLLPHMTVSNEPTRRECGAPDYIIQRNGLPAAFVEAKDIGDADLMGHGSNKEQFDRYKAALGNIVFTDYLDFLFFRDSEMVGNVRIAEPTDNAIVPIKDNFDKFLALIETLAASAPQRISSPGRLAQVMAAKTRLMAEAIESAIQGGGNSPLAGELEAFREVLIHDITPSDFADIYAQTITYGMFAARLHATIHQANGDAVFGRREAAELIPKTNPFLRRLFQTIAGFDLDDRISWIVDDLAEAFGATDMGAVMEGFGRFSKKADPVIHFYENFLSVYDPNLRKKRGVWYTPLPAVRFIVRAVDEILQKDFGLPMGLADASKVRVNIEGQGQVEMHKVQILDPAAGTGTFLGEAVKLVHERFEGQAGLWQSYVEQHIIPRLNGFELMMAPYAMAHLKLYWMLSETGFNPSGKQRLRVCLTNSLEERHPDTGTLFAQFLANEANAVKRDAPVMVVMGNPPYAVSSSNKGEWITGLLCAYKKDLDERNIQPLSDDYIKFIRLGQHFIEKNGEGILAYISNNSFLDGLIHRQMRKCLLDAFDKIYILDLHGNAMKKETAPGGGKDENVFDIQQGVSINIFVKTRAAAKQKKRAARVLHCGLWGRRDNKLDFLLDNSLGSIQWQELTFGDENYFFVPKDLALKEKYEKGFKVSELFNVSTSGVKTHDDDTLIGFTPFRSNNHLYAYRPFDTRYIDYDLKKVARHRFPVMKHFVLGENIGLVVSRQAVTDNWSHVQVVNHITDNRIHYSNKGIPNVCPLYLYSEQGYAAKPSRVPNLDPETVQKIASSTGLTFEEEKTGGKNRFAPIDLFDYVYAVLHSPSYREKYLEVLKIDFPRVPYPAGADQFRRLADIGAELRKLHLMEHPALDVLITKFPAKGSGVVEKVLWEPSGDGTKGRVWINAEQFFGEVPADAWDFCIGGYRPAQKWLKDRKDRELCPDEIVHYQRMIAALKMTGEIMGQLKSL